MLFFVQKSQAQQGNVNIKQSEKIETLMEVKKELNEDGKIGDRYVIQLFFTAIMVKPTISCKNIEPPTAILPASLTKHLIIRFG